jgi:hypothetical protein
MVARRAPVGMTGQALLYFLPRVAMLTDTGLRVSERSKIIVHPGLLNPFHAHFLPVTRSTHFKRCYEYEIIIRTPSEKSSCPACNAGMYFMSLKYSKANLIYWNSFGHL